MKNKRITPRHNYRPITRLFLTPRFDTLADRLVGLIVCTMRHTPYSCALTITSVSITVPLLAPTPPSPPQGISALFVTKNQLRVAWSMPPGLVQSIVDKREAAVSDLQYSHFVVYVSPSSESNWTRHKTSGPSTELLVVSIYGPCFTMYQLCRLNGITKNGFPFITIPTIQS